MTFQHKMTWKWSADIYVDIFHSMCVVDICCTGYENFIKHHEKRQNSKTCQNQHRRTLHTSLVQTNHSCCCRPPHCRSSPVLISLCPEYCAVLLWLWHFLVGNQEKVGGKTRRTHIFNVDDHNNRLSLYHQSWWWLWRSWSWWSWWLDVYVWSL